MLLELNSVYGADAKLYVDDTTGAVYAGNVDTYRAVEGGRASGVTAQSQNYKRYVAKMTQAGSDSAPVATIIDNTLGDIVWTRNSAGDYTGTLVGAFTEGKTLCSIGGELGVASGSGILLTWSSVDTVDFQTWALVFADVSSKTRDDDILDSPGVTISIEVWG